MSQDRLRLKLRPPAVGVPQGFGDLYFDEDGTLMKQTREGGIEEVAGADLGPNLTAYAADPAAAILANMPDALSGSSDPSAGDFASGSRDFTGVTINQGYKVVVGAYTFTWKNSPVGLFEIVAESPYFPSIEAGKLRDAVNASGIAFTATASVNVTSITADAVGEESNGGVMSGGADPTASGVFVGQLYRNTTDGTWWRWDGSAWVEDISATLATLLAALGVSTYADLAAANIALGIGKPFYNTALSALDITTA